MCFETHKTINYNDAAFFRCWNLDEMNLQWIIVVPILVTVLVSFFFKYVYNNNYNIQRYKFGLTRAMMSKRNFMQIYI